MTAGRCWPWTWQRSRARPARARPSITCARSRCAATSRCAPPSPRMRPTTGPACPPTSASQQPLTCRVPACCGCRSSRSRKRQRRRRHAAAPPRRGRRCRALHRSQLLPRALPQRQQQQALSSRHRCRSHSSSRWSCVPARWPSRAGSAPSLAPTPACCCGCHRHRPARMAAARQHRRRRCCLPPARCWWPCSPTAASSAF